MDMNVAGPVGQDDLSRLSSGELMRLEREIARRHSGMFPWLMVFWAFGNLLCWLALWPLVLTETIPLWLGFLIATVSVSLVYLPTHDAQHDIIARPGQKLRWLNELVGHATSWIIVSPFEFLRITHLDHHRHANDPLLDPDITTKASGPWQALWSSIRQRQPDAKRSSDYIASLQRANRGDVIILAIIYRIVFVAILSALAWNGLALEALLLWWLPYQISFIYLSFFLSWAPHYPGSETSRYRNTRSWRSAVGNIGSMGMQYHIVHHLHPYIPLDRTPAAYREMRPILQARGCELGQN